MTIPTSTDTFQQAAPASAGYPPEWDNEVLDEECDTTSSMVHCTLDLTAGSPFDPAPFDSFRAFLPTDGYVVYHLLDRWGDPLYIGQTGQPRARMRAHWSTKPWIGEVCGIRLIQTADELCARDVELMHTKRYRPPYSQVTLGERVLLARRLVARQAAYEADQ